MLNCTFYFNWSLKTSLNWYSSATADYSRTEPLLFVWFAFVIFLHSCLLLLLLLGEWLINWGWLYKLDQFTIS